VRNNLALAPFSCSIPGAGHINQPQTHSNKIIKIAITFSPRPVHQIDHNAKPASHFPSQKNKPPITLKLPQQKNPPSGTTSPAQSRTLNSRRPQQRLHKPIRPAETLRPPTLTNLLPQQMRRRLPLASLFLESDQSTRGGLGCCSTAAICRR
jgi:hypothetical protein